MLKNMSQEAGVNNPKLNAVYAQIPASTCPPECGKCCGILWPSIAELRNIYEWCIEHHYGYKDFTMVVGESCPYLAVDKRCEIYPVRPFLCRILGVSTDLPCPIRANKPSQTLNHAQSAWCYTQIYLKGKQKPHTEKHRKLIRQMLVSVSVSRR